MALSYRMILFKVLVLVLIILNIFVTSQSGLVDCRPLSLNYYQWSWDHGLILQSLPNGAAPGSNGETTHP
jgi:uncharacterized integral membrane protein